MTKKELLQGIKRELNKEFQKDSIDINTLSPFATIGAKKLIGASLGNDFIKGFLLMSK